MRMIKECEHITRVRESLKAERVRVYSEHDSEPLGWVNVHCAQCKLTMETVLGGEEADQ